MPFALTNPVNESVKTLVNKDVIQIAIVSINIRLAEKYVDIAYRKGFSDGDGGVEYGEEIFHLSFPPEEAVINEQGETVMTAPFDGLVQRRLSAYEALRDAVYNEIAADLSLEGSVV
jgi:hypothetical protein